MNIYPKPIPNNLFQPLANYWLPANGGRFMIAACEGVDYLYLDGECRLLHALPKKTTQKKNREEYALLVDLVNLVRPPAQWDDLDKSVPREALITWCETYGELLPMEIMPNGAEGVRVSTAQVEVLTFYLLYRLWQSMLLPPDLSRDILEQDQAVRFRLIQMLHRRYRSRNLFSPGQTLRLAAGEDDPARQRLLLNSFIQEVVNQRFDGLTPSVSLVHQPPQLVMQAQCPLTVAYWQLVNLMLKPDDARRYHICPCGRSFYGHANRKYCVRCDRRTEHSRRRRASMKSKPLDIFSSRG